MTFAETPTKLPECFGDYLQHQPLQGKKNCQIDADCCRIDITTTQPGGNSQKSTSKIPTKICVATLQREAPQANSKHPDHENLLLAKAATQFLKSRHKPMINLCGFAYKSKNVRRILTMMDMKLLQLFS
jgi:hypothetical protein